MSPPRTGTRSACVMFVLVGIVALRRGNLDAAQPSTAPSQFSIAFSDGTRATLLGICNDPLMGGKWWAANGLAIASPESGEIRSNVDGGDNTQTVRFIFECQLARAGRPGYMAKVLPSAITRYSGYGGNRLEVVAAVPRDAAVAEIRLGLGVDSWTDDVTFDASTQTLTSSQSPVYCMSDVMLSEESSQTLLSFTRVGERSSERDSQLIAMADGKAISISRGEENGTKAKFYFKTPLKSVSKIILQSRPFEIVSLKNVSLRPTTTPTDVQAIPSHQGQ